MYGPICAPPCFLQAFMAWFLLARITLKYPLHQWNRNVCIYIYIYIYIHEACPENIQPFWISREPVAWPWCSLGASQRRTYCASMNSHSPVRLVSRQWDVVDWACLLCDRRIHNNRASRVANLHHCAFLFYSSHAGFFGGGAKYRITQVCEHPYRPHLALCDFWFFPKLNSPLKVKIFVNATVT
jgi:hypothetical protein